MTPVAHPQRSAVTLARREIVIVAACIVLISALAAAYLLHLRAAMASSSRSATTMAQMGMIVGAAWSAADVRFTFTMWIVMMVGMMAPAAMPVLLVVAAAHARRAEHRAPTTVLLFALGYITLWLAFSACATLGQWALHDAALLSQAMAVESPLVGAAVLVAAGAYQLSPAKRACLQHCQTPMSFLMSHWREGGAGAFRMGLHHGLYCVGCCWALMAVLFVVGVMNLAWVAALTVFILIERIGPHGALVARTGGIVLIALGILQGLTA
jgi:predicted metal-binding membrane protein